MVTSRTSGSALQLRSQAGVQYHRAQWRFGAAIRTPGLTFYRSGAMTFDGLLDAGASSLGASVFDPEAEFEYHLPWEFQGGAAWVRDRIELEVDLQAYSSIDAYSMLATDNPVLVYGDAGTNRPPSVLSQPFAGIRSASDSVVNVNRRTRATAAESRSPPACRIGGNESPVSAEDQVFNKVDLVTWSIGLSGSLGRFQFSAGVNHQSGTAEDVTLRNLLNGQVVRSTIDVGMTGFIYSLAYQF